MRQSFDRGRGRFALRLGERAGVALHDGRLRPNDRARRGRRQSGDQGAPVHAAARLRLRARLRARHPGDPGPAGPSVDPSTAVHTALAPIRFKDFWRDLSLGAARLASSPRRPAKPAMTVGLGTDLIVPAGVAGDVPAGRVLDEAELVAVERADCVVDHVADLAGRSHNSHE
jgi:hypothetical protein